MREDFKINSSLLAKNTILNFIGQVLPIIVAFFSIPYVVKGLGVERFGILSLAWVVLEYFSLFDLGIGKATTKFVAEALGKGETKRIPIIVWNSLSFILLLGLVGGTVLAALTPLLVERVFSIPAHLVQEGKLTLYVLSIVIFITLAENTLNGVLEAYQRFDLVNMLKIPSSILSSIIPVIAIHFGIDLPGIVIFMAIKNLCMLFLYFFVCIKLITKSKFFSVDLKTVSSMLGYGGWITIIFLTSAIVTHIDKLFIGSLLPIAAVGFYTIPFSIINKLWILPISLHMTLFPIFSTFSTIGSFSKSDLEFIFARASKFLILSTGVVALFIVVLADKILMFWLGTEFVQNSTRVTQFLAVGFFLNAQAWIPSVLFQGIGRPDIVAKIFLLELPFYTVTLWWMITTMGIEGAAIVCMIKGAIDFFLFYTISLRLLRFRLSVFVQNGTIRGIMALVGFALVLIIITKLINYVEWSSQFVFIFGLFVIFGIVVWRVVLDLDEKSTLLKLLKMFWKQQV